MAVFCLLEPGNPEIFHDRMHFINTALFTVEFCVSRLRVRSFYVHAMLCWIYTYTITAWALKASDDHYEFMYFFLDLSSARSLIWYGLLYVMASLIYVFFAGLSTLKDWYARVADRSSDDQLGEKSLPENAAEESLPENP
eukprot:CAMPEP_0197659056 /NCGR_PEP_ID=MMETSP1338-20131121/46019_1 /TAXON_ID=43686 ORGANISM="Pelagodinium beii, Strain RCC1491" /NCGR_SAMPLE_ID=MMETSP1338 /ASSEMBLY_ACC=CAM_ASM_000754 /LENGTH=139 /DNA_ID=CAMNT_0043235801 /DNA_START=501 /DNA_END=920 /DNA_ORIENTATION=+